MDSTAGNGEDVIDVLVGRIGKPHGIRGEVTIDVRTDEPERRFADGAVLRVELPRGSASQLRALTVVSSRWHQGVLLVSFEQLGDRNAAEAARGLFLHAEMPVDATPDDPEEYYHHQLVGLRVLDLDGTRIGTVRGLVPGTAQDLLAVTAVDGRETLVPFVKALVPEVDLAGGSIVVADRPGLVSPFPDES